MCLASSKGQPSARGGSSAGNRPANGSSPPSRQSARAWKRGSSAAGQRAGGGSGDLKPSDEVDDTAGDVTAAHVAFFRRYGYVVVENAVPRELALLAASDVQNYLGQRHGLDLSSPESLAKTLTLPRLLLGRGLKRLW